MFYFCELTLYIYAYKYKCNKYYIFFFFDKTVSTSYKYNIITNYRNIIMYIDLKMYYNK